ncbi:MAG: exodeoxyribonuclease V subunit gamma [Sedimentisphaerales bacterium]|nr:exodeoxyribonuclease V subunit gamma [Sedimentisphaerales bacterium]
MAVQFILGRSGTGKTSYCVNAVVDALNEPGEQPLILLVPEQATYQAERAILGDDRIAGYSRLCVLSFDRLGFLLSGRNMAGPGISRIGRQMVIHRILRRRKDDLKLFGSAAERPGLARHMAETIAELHEYAKTPDDIDRLLSQLEKSDSANLAGLKFADVGLVLREYLGFIEGKFIDPDVQLARACRAVADAPFVKGARMWVDGFAGFTMSELAILAELLKTAKDSTIALCLDAAGIKQANPDIDSIDLAGLFYPTERTYAGLIEMINQTKLELAEPVVLEKAVRFSACPQLAHIERSASEDAPAKIPAGENIRIVSAPNERSEVRFVAEQILRLVREKGYRYRDIAVIASDIELYRHYVEAYFTDYNLPFFLDKRRPLNEHPVIALICSALQAAIGGFSGSDVFAYLKSDLVPIDRFDVDMLENYCLAFGISGSDWLDDEQWRFAGTGDDSFNETRIGEIRRSVAGPLLQLRERLCPAGNSSEPIEACEFTRAVFDLLDTLKAAETMAGWIERAGREEGLATVGVHQQFYSRLVDVFDELVEVFAGVPMPAEDYAAIIGSAFSQLTLAFIPPRLDQVLVGSIERSRHPDLKAVFLIGATQRQFPVPVSSNGVLTDDDRQAAESADFPLAPTTAGSLAERRYLAYIAFTRPSECLCVSYPAVDEKGGGVPRSQFVAELEDRFEGLAAESITGRDGGLERVCSKSGLIELLCSQLGKDALDGEAGATTSLAGLLDSMRSDDEFADAAVSVDSALTYDNRAQLDEEIVTDLFGRQVSGSATRLSSFAACPYQHFARYVLALEERKEFKLEPLDLGNFYHRALDAVVKRIKAAGQSFAATSDERLLQILRDEIAQIVSGDSFLSNFVRHGPHNAFVIQNAGEILEECVLAVARMVRAGRFEPVLSEVAFGSIKDTCDTLGSFEVALPGGRVLSVKGKIDRLDTATSDGRDIAVVFDYKRRAKSFGWGGFYHGLDMQLPIYMLAVRHSTAGERIGEIAGAFFMPVETGAESANLKELPAASGKFRHKANGIFNGGYHDRLDSGDESGWSEFYNFCVSSKGGQYGNYGKSGALRPAHFEAVLEYARTKIVSLVGDILRGRIDIRPYRIGTGSPCKWCKYKAVCRFDWQINDYNPLESLTKTEVLERIGVEDGMGC